jgi:hypothetical protein
MCVSHDATLPTFTRNGMRGFFEVMQIRRKIQTGNRETALRRQHPFSAWRVVGEISDEPIADYRIS